jgi:hypothetical protein
MKIVDVVRIWNWRYRMGRYNVLLGLGWRVGYKKRIGKCDLVTGDGLFD